MARDVTQIRKLGTCRVHFGDLDMGYTQGGVTVTITMDQVEILVDDFGSVPVDSVDVGTNIEAVTPLVQAILNNYEKVLWTGARTAAGPAIDRLTFGKRVGASASTGVLILDPINDTDGIRIHKAWCSSIDDLGYNNEGTRIIGAHWRGMIDESRANGDKVFHIYGQMS